MSSNQKEQDQAIALAGVFQAAALVHQLANKGMVSQDSFEASIGSIMATDPERTIDVFGGSPAGLSLGIKTMRSFINKEAEASTHILRYAMSILYLEKRLRKDPQMLSAIGPRLEQIKMQSHHFSTTHENVIASIAALYQDSISTFSFRIQVQGEPNILRQAGNADKVRALLFAGIRSGILWHQLGGRRWKLLIMRKKIIRALDSLEQN
ncbi:high frequency lysogenization protein [Oceanospirillum multiglobuliferum]|uniref:High frequency lysogenization protein HflD homolog n=1 Tax=Oceanospirillum multiglobuliferum TaxID=64969 RepID=A0A1T4SMN1_9GAMM|nr:high frequency lysogenization protein HflD [Oceanospirillum multiglobuliferum]OPX54126.1 lysogenization regulator HflD [Oceanospirillum multiglobuliferum]SKA29554.1 high frequency lysogenization protein [Oceanospirillum multiglobuliferum]